MVENVEWKQKLKYGARGRYEKQGEYEKRR